MKLKGIIFDLDGTLLDTLDDLTDAVNTVMQEYKYPVHDRAAVRSFVGSGLRSLMERSLPGSERSVETIDRCFGEMMTVYRKNYKDKSVPYAGINEMLEQLSAMDLPMAVFSNKAHELTVGLVEAKLPFNFVAVQGMTTEELKKPNPKVALQLAETMKLKPEECLYVGDSDTDMITATNAGMFALGVTWGFRDREDLLRSGAQKLIDTPRELLSIL